MNIFGAAVSTLNFDLDLLKVKVNLSLIFNNCVKNITTIRLVLFQKSQNNEQTNKKNKQTRAITIPPDACNRVE